MALLLAVLLLAAFAVGLWYWTRNTHTVWKIFARFCAVVMASLSGLTLMAFLFSGAMCGRYDFAPLKSADGSAIARVSEVDCGAIDSFHSSVELWRDQRGILDKIFGKRERLTTIFTIGHDPRL